MIKTINVLELASELAHKKVVEFLGESSCFVDSEDDVLFYTDEAQEIFNEEYDYYYNLIINIAEP